MNKSYEKDIHDLIYGFVIDVISLTKILPKNPQNDAIIYQLIKSATSMGANDQEADAAESRRDFIAKYTIVKKENKETNYWLRILGDTNSEEIKQTVSELVERGQEILRIVSSIVIKTKNKI